MSKLNIITIDLVKAVIHEVNLHNESPYEFKEIFNVRNHKNELYDLYDITDPDKPKALASGVRLDFQFTDVNVGRSFYTAQKSFGTMIKIFDKDTAIFENRELKALEVSDEDATEDDMDKAKAKNGGKLEYETVRRVIRKEQSSSFNNMRQYII